MGLQANKALGYVILSSSGIVSLLSASDHIQGNASGSRLRGWEHEYQAPIYFICKNKWASTGRHSKYGNWAIAVSIFYGCVKRK